MMRQIQRGISPLCPIIVNDSLVPDLVYPVIILTQVVFFSQKHHVSYSLWTIFLSAFHDFILC